MCPILKIPIVMRITSKFSIMKLKHVWIVISLVVVVFLFFGWGLWDASNQLLFPSWKGITKDFSMCNEEAAKQWGDSCGNLRATREFRFNEVKFLSINGYRLPGWLIRAEENGIGPANGVIMLVHGGGGDRREMTRYARFYLTQKLDVFTFDLSCHGEAPCKVPGLTYGQRESRDVLSAYLYLSDTYKNIFAMGGSVGAASILISLPAMPKLAGVIAENPMVSFQRLIREAPEAQSAPKTFVNLLLSLAMQRGRFDGLLNAENSLRLTSSVPIYFIHSKADKVVSYSQTEDLVRVYNGPKTVWFPEYGNHQAIREANFPEYEKKLEKFLNDVSNSKGI
jgi:alpha-beta hydrolase superfamily lysophospholipase